MEILKKSFSKCDIKIILKNSNKNLLKNLDLITKNFLLNWMLKVLPIKENLFDDLNERKWRWPRLLKIKINNDPNRFNLRKTIISTCNKNTIFNT